ncbi:MAG: hypothetical protein WDO16_08105 [Bacteroidota bacterium]
MVSSEFFYQSRSNFSLSFNSFTIGYCSIIFWNWSFVGKRYFYFWTQFGLVFNDDGELQQFVM